LTPSVVPVIFDDLILLPSSWNHPHWYSPPKWSHQFSPWPACNTWGCTWG